MENIGYSISKFRTELMGFAIICVLIGHIIAFGELNVPVAFDRFLHGIHTQGFLFLSGFGLYFSLSKDSSMSRYFTRRLYRFILPFLIMSVPFYLAVCFSTHQSVLDFFSYITTVNFWINGNYDGVWYVALSLVLYMLMPIVYSWISCKNRGGVLKLLIIIALAVIVNILLVNFAPDYWDKVSIGLKHTPMFFLGVIIAYVQRNNLLSNNGYLILGGVISIMYILFRVFDVEIPYLTTTAQLAFYIVLMCSIFSICNTNAKKINKVFSWLGQYTFEMYLMHIFIYEILISGLFNLKPINAILLGVIISIAISYPLNVFIKKVVAMIQKNI